MLAPMSSSSTHALSSIAMQSVYILPMATLVPKRVRLVSLDHGARWEFRLEFDGAENVSALEFVSENTRLYAAAGQAATLSMPVSGSRINAAPANMIVLSLPVWQISVFQSSIDSDSLWFSGSDSYLRTSAGLVVSVDVSGKQVEAIASGVLLVYRFTNTL